MKNATPVGVRRDKGHTGRSLFELALLHAPVLKNISGAKEGASWVVGWITHPRQKAWGSALFVPRRHSKTSRQAMKSSKQHPQQRPWLPTVIYCKTPSEHTNNGVTQRDTANQISRKSAWNDLWKANRSPRLLIQICETFPSSGSNFSLKSKQSYRSTQLHELRQQQRKSNTRAGWITRHKHTLAAPLCCSLHYIPQIYEIMSLCLNQAIRMIAKYSVHPTSQKKENKISCSRLYSAHPKDPVTWKERLLFIQR